MGADLQLVLPNDLRNIERVVHFLSERCHRAGFDQERLRLNFRVGVTEALTNAMLYGNARDPSKFVWVEVEVGAGAVTVRVTDEGRGFDPGQLEDPRLPENIALPNGRGIFLIRQLMDRVEFNERGNCITMVLLDGPQRGSGGE